MKKKENVKEEKSVNNWNRPEKTEVTKWGNKAFQTAIINAAKDMKRKYKYYERIDCESQ